MRVCVCACVEWMELKTCGLKKNAEWKEYHLTSNMFSGEAEQQQFGSVPGKLPANGAPYLEPVQPAGLVYI